MGSSMEGALRNYSCLHLERAPPGEDPGELTGRTPLITGGILDSIGTLKLVTYLEEQFAITIDAYEAGIDHLDTVDQIVGLVAEKRQAA